MRSQAETKIAYRKARGFVFDDRELSRIDKLDAAKRLRTKICALADRDGDPIEIANDAVGQVRQEMQIDRSARNVIARHIARTRLATTT